MEERTYLRRSSHLDQTATVLERPVGRTRPVDEEVGNVQIVAAEKQAKES